MAWTIGAGKATREFITVSKKYPERQCPGRAAYNVRNWLLCRSCSKTFPQSWVDESMLEAKKAGSDRPSGGKSRQWSPPREEYTNLANMVETLAKCIHETQGGQTRSTSPLQSGSGTGENTARDRLASIQVGEKVVVGLLDMGMARDHPAVVQLGHALDKMCKEHREGKPDSVHAGGVGQEP